MAWTGHLRLHYTHDGERTTALDRHEGPLRVLQRLYPEGPAVCHHVLVHPPGGVVGGDILRLDARLDAGSHALLTTPGATRFYRSNGQPALQATDCTLAAGSRLEWLPLEAIAYSGCDAENRLRFALEPGAEMIGWDLLALGLPATGRAFEAGRFRQRLELPGRWLEQGLIAADDRLLLDGPLGLAGRRVLATMWFAAGSPLAAARRDALLAAARELADADPLLAATAGASAPHAEAVVLRVLGERVEPVMRLCTAVWAAWRGAAWAMAAPLPRIWRT